MTNNKRQLTAIMFTDIVGYTAMVQGNESAAAAVRQRRQMFFKKNMNGGTGRC